MFIATETLGARTPSGVPCGGYRRVHFTPDGVSRPHTSDYKHCPPDGGPASVATLSNKASTRRRRLGGRTAHFALRIPETG